MSDEELANQLEGWLECEKCVISSHWDCLASTQQKDVLLTLAEKEGPPKPGERRRKSVKIDERAGFVCARCTAVAKCFVCHKERLPTDQDREVIKKQDEPEAMEPVAEGAASTSMLNGNTTMEVDVDDDTTAVRNLRDERPTANGDADEAENSPEAEAALMFRCVRCKLACHYLHHCSASEVGVDSSLARKASWYQETPRQWTCHQCRDWIWPVDIICAWRPSPADAVEPELDGDDGEPPSYKDALPREYLVKWAGRGFRHVTWIPHAWAIANAPQKLRHFLEKGPALDLVTDETLAARGDDMAQPTISSILAEDDKVKGDQKHSHGAREWKGYGPPPDKNAESSIPTEWCTIDRVLDVMLLPPKKKRKPTKINRSKRILSASATPEPEVEATTLSPRPDGVNPPEEEKMEIDEWEERSGRSLQPEDADEIAGLITWCFVKWDDLQYDQCELRTLTSYSATWDTPPPVDSPLYPAFKRALKRFLGARLVDLPVLSASEIKQREMAAGSMTKPPETQPSCIVGGTLMPFQLQGFQWLLYKHFKRESCILADDMGLGKTIQIASLLGYLGSSQLQIYPCLVLVPNSTITNWVREFEKWVPHIQVVPYYGEAASRKIISKYELYHKGLQGEAHGLRAHVVLTTYDMITGSEFRVFGGIPRWEVLCVDEGQRLKSDNSLIFNRLKTLNSVHRILLTGTPLNNNLRELFNLLNFLDKETFRHLQDLEARFQDLDEAKVTELHEMIKPYILRRIKADVLKLPPKIEIIVPISLAPLQKNVYKTILERNADLLKAIGEARQRKVQKEARELKMARKTSAEGDPIVVD
ncbi:SNF2 family N-terminal domain-domain-containing protein [Kockovaella imperatae]|uniref:SNF2 family N-terminal domain-domain-containing protein n=1 Tax=Kockovaella imperatae TaxID=4999 RepID=A0A1Y1UH20_9TREE|nr:SNF2 family N-terminal domain-domain-containing protein [Kockovaella imperatae]ORX37279.1 SNF2 family N-terminal domain-domain-containing protein [Kockovaella imperatae]